MTVKDKRLTPRLAKVVSYVPDCKACADIGCDHAQVAIWLVKQKKVLKMTAADVNIGPLNRAKRAVEDAGLGGQISCVLSDGLDNIPPQDCVIIAGMGGDLIADVLSRAEWTRQGERTLILQPMTAAYRLREFLSENGYRVVEESYAAEKKKLYAIICAKPGQERINDISELYMSRAGERDALAGEYARKVMAKLETELSGLERAEFKNIEAIEHRKTAAALLKKRFSFMEE